MTEPSSWSPTMVQKAPSALPDLIASVHTRRDKDPHRSQIPLARHSSHQPARTVPKQEVNDSFINR